MQFTTHSPQKLFDKKHQEYAQVKLQRPILRHKLDQDGVSVRVDAEERGTSIQIKVALIIPGQEHQLISTAREELTDAIDSAADKMERLLRDYSDRKRVRRQSNKAVDYTEELGEDDYLTDGEEDVLKALGALDTVLDL